MSTPGSEGNSSQRDLLGIATAAPLYNQLDSMRRQMGKMLDLARLGVCKTRHRAVMDEHGFIPRDYSRHRTGPAVLLVPAPIKAAYIWDLTPHGSVVRRCLDAGFQVLAVEWRPPASDSTDAGLAAYAGAMLGSCVDASRMATRQQRIYLVGHSLGGTLAEIFACLHPERLRGLVLLGTPLNFGPRIGVFGPLVSVAPRAVDIVPTRGNIPGSLLSLLTVMAAPNAFGWARLMDFAVSATDSEALEVGRRRVRPAELSAPLLAVVDARCSIAPPDAVLLFVEAAGSVDKQVLWYGGDVGVSLRHVGMLIGRNAHRHLWPQIEMRMRERS